MESLKRYSITLDERGRLVLPARLRRKLDVKAGDRLLVMVEGEGTFRVVSAWEQARRLRGVCRDLAPGRSLADELIAERKDEARQ